MRVKTVNAVNKLKLSTGPAPQETVFTFERDPCFLIPHVDLNRPPSRN